MCLIAKIHSFLIYVRSCTLSEVRPLHGYKFIRLEKEASRLSHTPSGVPCLHTNTAWQCITSMNICIYSYIFLCIYVLMYLYIYSVCMFSHYTYVSLFSGDGRIVIHLKFADCPLLVLGVKPIYETGSIYKSCWIYSLILTKSIMYAFMLIKLGNIFTFAK